MSEQSRPRAPRKTVAGHEPVLVLHAYTSHGRRLAAPRRKQQR